MNKEQLKKVIDEQQKTIQEQGEKIFTLYSTNLLAAKWYWAMQDVYQLAQENKQLKRKIEEQKKEIEKLMNCLNS